VTRRPVIGLSTGVLPFAYGAVPDYPLNYVPDDYVQAVLAAGGLPLTLPMYNPALYPDGPAEQLELCDGLLLSGGNADVSPATYGEDPHPELGVTTPHRDAHELALLAEARRRGIPVLGICRGIQVVNVAYGGTLYQDLPSQFPETLGHVQTRHRSEPHHEVAVAEGSRLYEAVGSSIGVTSFHHQAVKELGTGLVAVAVAPDGLVEAVEARDQRWLVAVQWHPEMSHVADVPSQELFAAFVAQCGATS